MNIKDEGRITELLDKGVRTNVYPGAVLLVALGCEILFTKATGLLSIVPPQSATREHSIFDLASLTKPFASTLAIMKLVDSGEITLDQPLAEILPCPVPDEKQNITVRLLLCHSSGLTDWKPYYTDLMKYNSEERKVTLRKCILNDPLEYPSGMGTKYSDLGFMLLEWIIEEASGIKMDELLTESFYKPLNLNRTFLIKKSAPFNLEEIAATEDCPWRKRVIRGEVHDENAYALGGYSGHAGLFGCARDLFVLLNMLREHYNCYREDFFRNETVRHFFRRQNVVKDSTWALGWDTPSIEGSSSGKYFSSESVGHLGFTGTSVWMDLEKDVTVIFLTNRVHKTRENVKIRLFRPVLHDLIMESIFIKKG